MRDIEFVQQLLTKFCHELSGPVGAVGNGLEAMEIDPKEMFDANMEMTQNSANSALARLMFFRHTYGIARSESKVSVNDIKSIIDNYLLEYRIKVVFVGANEVEFYNSSIKIFLCLIWLSVKALPQGGQIEVSSSQDEDGKKQIKLVCTGAKISSDMLKLDILEGRKTEVSDTPEVHSYYTKRLIDDIGADLNIQIQNNRLEFLLTIIAI